MPHRTLLLGADGFIGRHLAFGLRALGHEVTCVAKNPATLHRMGFKTLAADFTNPKFQVRETWRPHLATIDHVINAAGLLIGSPDDFKAVHVTTPAAIYAAMKPDATGVLISAVGIDSETNFAVFRRQGETVALDHNISALRCGLVLADTAYGGSSLIRALAALPLVTPIPAGIEPPFNPIHATDLAQIIDTVLQTPPATNPIDIGGPETLTLREILTHYRTWLGLPVPRFLPLPTRILQTVGIMGDFCKCGPISRTSLTQLNAGVHANTTAMHREIASAARPFSSFANSRPPGTSDLWHARLYLAKPALRLTLAFLWFVSGLLGLLLPAHTFLPLIDSQISDQTLVLLARLGGLADLAIAAALLRDWQPKRTTQIQFAMILGYTAAFTLLAPTLWLLPLGGLLKNIPILALLCVHTILQKER